MRHKILSSSRTSGVGGRVEKNFVAAAVFSVSYFLNVVEEFRSCLSKPEGSVCHFGLSIGWAVMTSHSRCAKDSASCDTKFCLLCEPRTSGVGGSVVEEFRSCGGRVVEEFRSCCGRVVEEFRSCLSKLKEACAISGPCTSTRTWSVFHCSPYLSQLTRCGRIQNEPSSVAWRPLSQLTHCGLKILSRLTCFITFSLAAIQVSIIHVTVTKVNLAQSVSELHCN